jgi:hypothetical protein
MVGRRVSVSPGELPRDESEACATTAVPPRAGIGAPQRALASLMGYQTMRRRLFGILGTLAVAGLLASPVSAAAPVENGWNTFTGRIPDNSCTGEAIDDHGSTHSVILPGPFSHLNVHWVGIGETSGVAYVSDTTINAPAHRSPDGTFTFDFLVNLNVVSAGGSSNATFKLADHQVYDSSGNLISETTNVSSACRGS